MNITDKKYFEEYHNQIGKDIENRAAKFNFKEQSENLSYATQASAVYSSNIEGNSIDLNSFMNYKLSSQKFKPQKELQEIDNLVTAYEWAQKSSLNEKNFLYCHKLLAKTLVIASKRGKYRTDKIGVFSQSGLVYLAIEPEFVIETMQEFFKQIALLLQEPLSPEEAFYHASFIHLKLAHIHPFQDGNGRAARLLEKWFLAATLGQQYWQIPSEKYYKDHQATYYHNINLGVNYYELNYDKCLPFLKMLPHCLENKS